VIPNNSKEDASRNKFAVTNKKRKVNSIKKQGYFTANNSGDELESTVQLLDKTVIITNQLPNINK